MSSTFFASSIIGSTLEIHDSSFFNISAKPNASIQEQGSNSFTSTISNCAFNHVCDVYNGVLIPSISFGVSSLANFNSTHVSCTRWANKRYSNETLERVVLDPFVDKEFAIDSCTWNGIKGDEFGQRIFARTQDQTVLTVDVINCKFQNCTSYIGSGGAIFVTGNVAVTIENSSFQDINCENENKNAETTTGAIHVISIRSPAIRQCLFFNCNSKADACVIFEHRATKIPERKADLNGNSTILQQSYHSQIRERNNFPFEGNDKKMQTKLYSDPDKFFEEVEPVCLQCTFLRCYSQRSGGGLYLKDVEDQALVSECDFSGCKADYGGAIYVAVADSIAGAVYTKDGYLSVDVPSLRGNSAGFGLFPGVAHNIVCEREKGRKEEGKGVIELVKGDSCTSHPKHDDKKGKQNLLSQNDQRKEESNEEFPDNFWIESNNCTLVGFPADSMSSLFTPQPENVSITEKKKKKKKKKNMMMVNEEEGYEVLLRGKFLYDCYLTMQMLANKTTGERITNELVETATADKLNCFNEIAISAYFPANAVDCANGADSYVALKFSPERAFKEGLTTIPLCVRRGKGSEGAEEKATLIVIAVVAVVATGLGYGVVLLCVRRKWKKKGFLGEYEEGQGLLNSINSEISRRMEKGDESWKHSSNISNYGTITKLIDIPPDIQEPFLEE